MAVQIQRRDFILTLSGAAAWPLVARAQQPDRLSRIIVLMGIANDLEGQERVAAFRQGLQAAGWTEGSNVKIDYHWVGGDADRARTYAAEVVRLKPNVILANGTAVVAALKTRDPVRTDRVRAGARSSREWLCRWPCAPGRQYYRVHDV